MSCGTATLDRRHHHKSRLWRVPSPELSPTARRLRVSCTRTCASLQSDTVLTPAPQFFLLPVADPLRSSQDSRPSAGGDYNPSQSQSPPGSILPSYLTPDSSRANSFDRARAGSPYSQVNSVGSNPFRDPSLDWVRGTSFENDAHSILSSAASESANENGGYRPSPGERRPSEVQRDLSSAVADELPRISEDSLSPPREYTPPPSSTATPKTGSTSKKGGLLHQFRTGTKCSFPSLFFLSIL